VSQKSRQAPVGSLSPRGFAVKAHIVDDPQTKQPIYSAVTPSKVNNINREAASEVEGKRPERDVVMKLQRVCPISPDTNRVR
jgi:hypothetical protein